MNKTDYQSKVEKDRAIQQFLRTQKFSTKEIKPARGKKDDPILQSETFERPKSQAFNLTDFQSNKTIQIGSASLLNDLIFDKTDQSFFGNQDQAVSKLKQKLQEKKNERQKQKAQTLEQDDFSKTQVDAFNLNLMKDRQFGLGGDASSKNQGIGHLGAPVMPSTYKDKLYKTMSSKNFVVNRYRSHKTLKNEDGLIFDRPPPPPLGKTTGHGLFPSISAKNLMN